MSDISIEIENVRCFRERTVVPLAPLTLLVGENSTGKSTFLSMIRLASDIANRRFDGDFNEEPFLLGSFENIASLRTGRAKNLQFSVGIQAEMSPTVAELLEQPTMFVRCHASFSNEESQPRISSWSLASGNYAIEIESIDQTKNPRVSLTTPQGITTFEPRERRSTGDLWGFRDSLMVFLVRNAGLDAISDTVKETRRWNREDLERFDVLSECLHGPRPIAIAPVRTRPQRTYDLLTDVARPEGNHVPMVLARILGSTNSHRLKSAINSFGKASGLFDKVKVKPLGDNGSGPFQIQIDFGGPNVNLIDTGYGISQVLPIVVDALRSEQGSRLLIQQPEVHLHPRAQAELGSLLLHLSNEEHKSFVVETHSDYLIGRVMSEVRESGIDPAKVRILYFERQDPNRVQIHPLTLDEQGNIIDAPISYRSFFLEEERRLLGV